MWRVCVYVCVVCLHVCYPTDPVVCSSYSIFSGDKAFLVGDTVTPAGLSTKGQETYICNHTHIQRHTEIHTNTDRANTEWSAFKDSIIKSCQL